MYLQEERVHVACVRTARGRERAARQRGAAPRQPSAEPADAPAGTDTSGSPEQSIRLGLPVVSSTQQTSIPSFCLSPFFLPAILWAEGASLGKWPPPAAASPTAPAAVN